MDRLSRGTNSKFTRNRIQSISIRIRNPELKRSRLRLDYPDESTLWKKVSTFSTIKQSFKYLYFTYVFHANYTTYMYNMHCIVFNQMYEKLVHLIRLLFERNFFGLS